MKIKLSVADLKIKSHLYNRLVETFHVVSECKTARVAKWHMGEGLSKIGKKVSRIIWMVPYQYLETEQDRTLVIHFYNTWLVILILTIQITTLKISKHFKNVHKFHSNCIYNIVILLWTQKSKKCNITIFGERKKGILYRVK